MIYGDDGADKLYGESGDDRLEGGGFDGDPDLIDGGANGTNGDSAFAYTASDTLSGIEHP